MEIGDLVKLKSGGPCMTIVDRDGPRNVVCSWFVGHIQHRHSFPEAGLVPSDPATGDPWTEKLFS